MTLLENRVPARLALARREHLLDGCQVWSRHQGGGCVVILLAVGGRKGYTVNRLAGIPPDGSRAYRRALLMEAYEKMKVEVQRMKELMILIAGGILSAALPLVAATETVGGYTWTYRLKGDTAEIYNNGYVAISPKPTGPVTIPATLGGKLVTSIGAHAFQECHELTAVTMPNGILNIGDCAFACCSNLEFPPIGSNVTNIGYYAFGQCDKIENITIPNSVETIGHMAFYLCSPNILTIGNGVKRIGDEAFGGYGDDHSKLRSVTIPASVTSIGMYVFSSKELKNVTLPMWCKSPYVCKSDRGYLLTAETISGHETISGFKLSDWSEYLGLSSKAKITYKDVGGGSSGGDVAEIWKKAQTVNGAVFRNGRAVGIVQVKVGKASKNGEVAVSGTITGLDGKKLAAKGGKVGVSGETATATLAVKDGTTATVTVGKDGVSGSWDGAEIKAAEVGGILPTTTAWFQVLDYMPPSVDNGYVTLDHLVPYVCEDEDAWPEPLTDVEPVYVNHSTGKWTCDKAASLKFVKSQDGSLPDCIECVSWGSYYLTGLWDEKKPNISALKLNYAPKTGLFKGSFGLYAWNGPSLQEGAKPKLKKYTANVTGVVVDGKGAGQASIKKPAGGPWPVTVE